MRRYVRGGKVKDTLHALLFLVLHVPASAHVSTTDIAEKRRSGVAEKSMPVFPVYSIQC